MSGIALSSAMRTNLLSLNNTAELLRNTQTRLSTGRKVNTALDNPSNFFTAQGMTSRSGQLSSLLDGMSNAIQTIQAADRGIKAVTKLLENMQSTARQARQDAAQNTPGATLSTTSTIAAGSLQFRFVPPGGELETVTVSTTASGRTITGAGTMGTGLNAVTAINGATTALGAGRGGDVVIQGGGLSGAVTVTLGDDDTLQQAVDKINSALSTDSNGLNVRASISGGALRLTALGSAAITNTLTVSDATGSTSRTRDRLLGDQVNMSLPDEQVMTGAQIAQRINTNADLEGKISASVGANGTLQLQALTTFNVNVRGITAAGNISGVVDGTGDHNRLLTAGSASASERRTALASEFNTLVEQFNEATRDSGFNGVNLLRGDALRVVFNELTGANQTALNVRANNSDGSAFGDVTAERLGIDRARQGASTSGVDFRSNSALDDLIGALTNAMTTTRNLASQLSNNLSVVQNRQDFTKGMINVLQVGADNLTLADMNEEAANALALQTRLQLGQSALSLTSQQDQGVLQLLR